MVDKQVDVQTGDPVILYDVSGLEFDELYVGQRGFSTGVLVMSPTETIVGFAPDDVKRIYMMNVNRVEVDVEEKERIEAMGGLTQLDLPLT